MSLSSLFDPHFHSKASVFKGQESPSRTCLRVKRIRLDAPSTPSLGPLPPLTLTRRRTEPTFLSSCPFKTESTSVFLSKSSFTDRKILNTWHGVLHYAKSILSVKSNLGQLMLTSSNKSLGEKRNAVNIFSHPSLFTFPSSTTDNATFMPSLSTSLFQGSYSRQDKPLFKKWHNGLLVLDPLFFFFFSTECLDKAWKRVSLTASHVLVLHRSSVSFFSMSPEAVPTVYHFVQTSSTPMYLVPSFTPRYAERKGIRLKEHLVLFIHTLHLQKKKSIHSLQA